MNNKRIIYALPILASLLGCNSTDVSNEFSCDFGDIVLQSAESRGREIRNTFRIVNVSSTSELLKVVSQSCNCFRVDFPTHEIKSSESIDITLSMTVTAKSSTFSNSAFLRWGDGREVKLRVFGRVYEQISITADPPGILDFAHGKPAKTTVSISCVDKKNNPHVETIVESSKRLKRYEVPVVSHQRVGSIRILTTTIPFEIELSEANRFASSIVQSENLLVRHGNDKMNYTIRWRFLDSIDVKPRRVILQSATGEPISKSVTLSSDRPFAISKIDRNETEELTARFAADISATSHSIILTWSPTKATSSKPYDEVSFGLSTTHPDQLELSIPAYLIGEPANQFDTSDRIRR